MADKTGKMPERAHLCPFCKGLNSAGERRCYRCGRALPGPLVSAALDFVRDTLGSEAPMTRALLGFCLLVCGLSVASDRRLPIWISDQFSGATLLRFGALVGPLGAIEPWRYLAAVFVHMNVLHIGLNGWSLVAVGPTAEREFGSARFAVLFIVSGVLGFVVSDQWYGGAGPLTAGASGAICGAFGSVVGVAYARRDSRWKQVLVQNLVNLAIIGFAFPVNNAAHVGGLVVGAGLGFLFDKERRRFGLGKLAVALSAMLLALVPLSVVLANASPFWRAERARESAQQH
ncbi:MAG TPA: rhomboid family intramembrane serine protease [Polyangiaceae bacterium]